MMALIWSVSCITTVTIYLSLGILQCFQKLEMAIQKKPKQKATTTNKKDKFDDEFRHYIVNEEFCGSPQISPHGSTATLTMSWRTPWSWINNMTDARNTDGPFVKSTPISPSPSPKILFKGKWRHLPYSFFGSLNSENLTDVCIVMSHLCLVLCLVPYFSMVANIMIW